MKSIYLLATSLVLASLSSCSGESTSPEASPLDTVPAVIPDTVEIGWQDWLSDSVQEGTVVIFEGYIGDPGQYVSQTNGTMSFPIYERRNQRAGMKVNLTTNIGGDPNEVHELPEQFLQEDFKVVAHDGSILTKGNFVRITAIKGATYDPGYRTATTVRIESLPDPDYVPPFNLAVPLTDLIMQDSAQKEVYCYVDGQISVPSIILSYSTEITLDLLNSSVKDMLTIAVPLGSGPSTMNDLPENYEETDLVLRDYLGVPVPYKAKVRLYGMWQRYEFEATYPGNFYLEEIAIRK